MRRGAGGENGSRIGLFGELGDGARDIVDRWRHKKPRLISKDCFGNATDGRGYARKAAGRGLQVDESEPFHPSGGIRYAGQTKEVGRAIDVANILVGYRAEKADVAVRRRDEASQLPHMVVLAIWTDDQPCDPLADFLGK